MQTSQQLENGNGAWHLLTQREHEITALVTTALSNKAIALRLNLTEGTIKAHLHNIYRKLRVANLGKP